MIRRAGAVSTIEPPLPAAIMCGTAALTVMNMPVSFTSISSRNCSTSISQVGAARR